MNFQIPPSQYQRFQITFGALCSTIFDLDSGKAFHMNASATRILKKFISKTDTAQLPKDLYQELLKIDFLKKNGSINDELTSEGQLPSRPLKKVWIELTNRCNQKCVHCYASASPQSSDGLDTKMIFQFLENIFSLGCETVQFTGGEPLLRNDLVLFCDLARQNQVKEIEIFSNLSSSKRKLLDKLVNSNVIISTTVLAPDAETHDRLTRTPGSFDRMLSNIKYLQSLGVSINASIILMAETETRYDQITKFCDSIGVHYGEPDPVRPFGRGKNEHIRCRQFQNVKYKPFFETTSRSFLYAMNFNPCWGHMLFLRYDGKVVPCPHARNFVLGDVRKDSFIEILKTASLQAWSITLDKVEICRECEFRYLCSDCRPLAFEENTAKLMKKNYRCLYDPYTGKWQNLIPKSSKKEVFL